jgi:hypothetical protein
VFIRVHPWLKIEFQLSKFLLSVLSCGHMLFGIPLVGDPTLVGWTTFALYLVAAFFSFQAATASRSRAALAAGRVWNWIAIVLLVLGLNKQLDLQSWIIHSAGRIAQKEQLYQYRRALHAVFFAGLVVVIGAAVFRWSEKLKQFARALPKAATGCALVGAYILIRAASIDQVDQMLGFDLERVPSLWLLEVGGLALIIVEARSLRHET